MPYMVHLPNPEKLNYLKMKNATILKGSIAAILSLTGILLIVLLVLLQQNTSPESADYFTYGHYLIVAYLLLIAAVWTGKYPAKRGLQNAIVLLLSVAATANILIYWVGEYLTGYARDLFSGYVQLPTLEIAVLLVGILVFNIKSQPQRLSVNYLYFSVLILAVAFIALFPYQHALLLTLLTTNSILSILYSTDNEPLLNNKISKFGIVPFISLSLIVAAFSVFVFIQYKPNLIAGKQEQALALHLPENTGVKVFILNTGFNRMTKALSPGNPKWRPAPVFLIQHPTFGYLLFDTGIAKEVASKGQGAMAFPMPLLFESKTDVNKIIDAQLLRYGISTDSIKTIIISHLHKDHTGGLPLFKKANVIVHSGTPLVTPGLKVLNASSFTKHSKIIGNAFDLLGDSTLLLIESEGHTKDDLMLMVAADQGPLLLAGDAVVHFDWLTSDDVERLPENAPGAASVRNKIRQLLKINTHLLLFPGHDLPTIPNERKDVQKLFIENFTLKTNQK